MSVEKDVTEKESMKITREFTQVCAEMGDLKFKIRELEKRQDYLNIKYKEAFDKEQATTNPS